MNPTTMYRASPVWEDEQVEEAVSEEKSKEPF
jgi:hypothetical protein